MILTIYSALVIKFTKTWMFPCCSVFRKVSIWQSHDIDYILCTLDKIYKNLDVSKYLNVDDLPVTNYLYDKALDVVFLS